jgi:hypothetical protein
MSTGKRPPISRHEGYKFAATVKQSRALFTRLSCMSLDDRRNEARKARLDLLTAGCVAHLYTAPL